MTDRNLDDLHPDLKPLCQEVIDTYTSTTGRKITITETWRDPAREDKLHAQGITAATGLTCKHCFLIDGKPASKAFDFALFLDNGDYIADGTHAYYAVVGQIAKKLGLVWGGYFHHPDYDHIELNH